MEREREMGSWRSEVYPMYNVGIEEIELQGMALYPISYDRRGATFRAIPDHRPFFEMRGYLDHMYRVAKLVNSNEPLVIPGPHIGASKAHSSAFLAEAADRVQFAEPRNDRLTYLQVWVQFLASTVNYYGGGQCGLAPLEKYTSSSYMYQCQAPEDVPGWAWRGLQLDAEGNLVVLHHYSRIHPPPPLFPGFQEMVSRFLWYPHHKHRYSASQWINLSYLVPDRLGNNTCQIRVTHIAGFDCGRRCFFF